MHKLQINIYLLNFFLVHCYFEISGKSHDLKLVASSNSPLEATTPLCKFRVRPPQARRSDVFLSLFYRNFIDFL